MRLFAIAAPGLEGVLAAEVRGLQAGAVKQVVGGVEFEGDVAEANLRLRTATRVLVRIGEARAKDFARLEKVAAGLPWADYAGTGEPELTVTARKSRLYHTGAIAERVARAIGGRGVHAFVRAEDDVFTFSVDSSGELLHRRGYREETAKAPLRETLAAGLLLLAEWDRETPLVDPMCGSGTIGIEAALLASGALPRRHFRFQEWPAYRSWQPPPSPPPRKAPVFCSDRDAGAVEAARRNAARAGVELSIDCLTLAQARLPPGPGLVLCNAPYGKRIQSTAWAADLARLAGSAPGWRLAVLAAEKPIAAPAAEHRLDNGGLRVRLFVYASFHGQKTRLSRPPSRGLRRR